MVQFGRQEGKIGTNVANSEEKEYVVLVQVVVASRESLASCVRRKRERQKVQALPLNESECSGKSHPQVWKK